MKAAVVPSKDEQWQIREVETPEPGPNQVLIKIHASGICYTDVHQTQGSLPGAFPRVLGHEPCGQISAVGSAVTTRKVGDRVGVPWVQSTCGRCEWCLRGRPMFCAQQFGTSVEMGGGHAEYMLAHADSTMPIPDNLSYEQAAPVFCAGFTVWSGLRWAKPQPGQVVAVVGVGGLGHLAVQYAKAAGFTTIAVSRSADKVDFIKKSLGADEVVVDGAGLARAGGADVVLCTGNSTDSMVDAVKGTRPDGCLVVMGFDEKPLQLSPGDLIMKRLRIIGSQQNNREYLYEALQLVAQGRVRVHTETFAFDDVHNAYSRVAEGKVRYRAVLKF
jgi:alcohol dehydrogenase